MHKCTQTQTHIYVCTYVSMFVYIHIMYYDWKGYRTDYSHNCVLSSQYAGSKLIHWI